MTAQVLQFRPRSAPPTVRDAPASILAGLVDNLDPRDRQTAVAIGEATAKLNAQASIERIKRVELADWTHAAMSEGLPWDDIELLGADIVVAGWELRNAARPQPARLYFDWRLEPYAYPARAALTKHGRLVEREDGLWQADTPRARERFPLYAILALVERHWCEWDGSGLAKVEQRDLGRLVVNANANVLARMAIRNALYYNARGFYDG